MIAIPEIKLTSKSDTEYYFNLRNKIREYFSMLKELNELPFYPQQEVSFTELINGFSSMECNRFHDILERFLEKFKNWDFRE